MVWKHQVNWNPFTSYLDIQYKRLRFASDSVGWAPFSFINIASLVEHSQVSPPLSRNISVTVAHQLKAQAWQLQNPFHSERLQFFWTMREWLQMIDFEELCWQNQPSPILLCSHRFPPKLNFQVQLCTSCYIYLEIYWRYLLKQISAVRRIIMSFKSWTLHQSQVVNPPSANISPRKTSRRNIPPSVLPSENWFITKLVPMMVVTKPLDYSNSFSGFAPRDKLLLSKSQMK